MEIQIIGLEQFDNFTSMLSDTLSMPQDQCCFIFIMLLSFPLSFCFRFIDKPFYRNLFGMSFGFLSQFLLYRKFVLVWWIPQVCCYFILILFGRKATLPVIVICVTFLEGIHIYRYYNSYLMYTVEVDNILMTGMMKLVAFSISFYDGQNLQEDKDYVIKYAKKITKRKHIQNQIVQETMERAIIEIPSFYNYLGYMNCFFTGFVGPYIDYIEHQNWLEKRGAYANIPFHIYPILAGIFQMAFFGYVYSTYFAENKPTNLITQEFMAQPQYYKYGMMLIMSFLLRCRYHFSFSMLQFNFILSGIAYGKDEKGNDIWDKIATQNWKLEIPYIYSVRERINFWNIQGTNFFRRYTYNRMMSIFQHQFLCMFLVFVSL